MTIAISEENILDRVTIEKGHKSRKQKGEVKWYHSRREWGRILEGGGSTRDRKTFEEGGQKGGKLRGHKLIC